jgi:hypothetical protein
MSRPAPKRKPVAGPRYYRTPPLWGLVGTFLIVIVLIILLFKLG